MGLETELSAYQARMSALTRVVITPRSAAADNTQYVLRVVAFERVLLTVLSALVSCVYP